MEYHASELDRAPVVPATPRPPPRILIVEDEAIIAWQLEDMIRDLGYEVVGLAADPDSALNAAIELRPDAIVMDVRLRASGDGVAAAAAILADRAVPVVFCTAFADDPATRRRLEPLASGIVAKPIRGETLRAVLERALRPAD